MSDDKEDISVIRRCTKCKSPMKNHRGPAGEHCQNTEDSSTEGATGGESTRPKSDLSVSLLREMMRQMGDMALSMEMMQKSLAAKQRDDAEFMAIMKKTGDGAQPPHDSTIAGAVASDSAIPAHITPKTVTAIKSGEYINLYDLLPSDSVPTNEMVALQNNDGTMSFQPKKIKKTVDNFDQWLSAWSLFEQILVMIRPTLYGKLTRYRQFVHTCDRKYQWYAVSIYDKRFRAKLAETRSFDYDSVDTTLYVSILDASAVKNDAKHCYRCKSILHRVSDCPFPATEKVGKDSQTGQIQPPNRFNNASRGRFGQQRTPERFLHDGKEICNNWQYDNCKYPHCNRAHVCKGCRGPTPQHRCATCTSGNVTYQR